MFEQCRLQGDRCAYTKPQCLCNLQVPARVEALDLPKDFYYHDRNDPTAAVLQATPNFAAAEGVLESQIGVFRDAGLPEEEPKH